MNQIEAMRRRIMELRRAAGDHGIGGGSNPVIQASASSVSATAAPTMVASPASDIIKKRNLASTTASDSFTLPSLKRQKMASMDDKVMASNSSNIDNNVTPRFLDATTTPGHASNELLAALAGSVPYTNEQPYRLSAAAASVIEAHRRQQQQHLHLHQAATNNFPLLMNHLRDASGLGLDGTSSTTLGKIQSDRFVSRVMRDVTADRRGGFNNRSVTTSPQAANLLASQLIRQELAGGGNTAFGRGGGGSLNTSTSAPSSSATLDTARDSILDDCLAITRLNQAMQQQRQQHHQLGGFVPGLPDFLRLATTASAAGRGGQRHSSSISDFLKGSESKRQMIPTTTKGTTTARSIGGSSNEKVISPPTSDIAPKKHKAKKKRRAKKATNPPSSESLASKESHAKATAKDSTAGTSPCKPGICLYTSSDDKCLSQFQCLARKQIELFQATEQDVDAGARGRNVPIKLGQVGIRCKHCSHVPSMSKRRAAVYFPTKYERVYQTAVNMATLHLCQHCQHIPDDIKAELNRLKDQKSTSGGGKRYVAIEVRRLGVIETANDGLRLVSTEAEAQATNDKVSSSAPTTTNEDESMDNVKKGLETEESSDAAASENPTGAKSNSSTKTTTPSKESGSPTNIVAASAEV